MRSTMATLWVTLDGVVQGLGRADEDTRGGFTHGGWGRRYDDEVMGREMAELKAQPGGDLGIIGSVSLVRYVAVRDGVEYRFRGCFHEVRPDRIVQTFTFEGDPDGVALETLWFEDLGDGRTRLRTQSLVGSFEGRDAWLRSGMETGVDEGYAKLCYARSASGGWNGFSTRTPE